MTNSEYVYEVYATVRGKRRRIDICGLKKYADEKAKALKKKDANSKPSVKKVLFKKLKRELEK